MENRDIKLAYIAGALDGYGSFSLIKATAAAARSPLYYPMILLEFCDTFKAMNGRKCLNGNEISFREQYYYYIVQLNKNGVSKSSLIDLKPLPDNAGGNKAEATKVCTVNVVSEKTTQVDAVL